MKIFELADKFGFGVYSSSLKPYDKLIVMREGADPMHFSEFIREEHVVEDLRSILESLKKRKEKVLARAKTLDEIRVEREAKEGRWKHPVPLTEAEIEEAYDSLVKDLGGLIAAAEEAGI